MKHLLTCGLMAGRSKRVASRKIKYNASRIYKITYKSGDKLFYANVAACSLTQAVSLWIDTGEAESLVTLVEKTDQLVYYGVNR